MSRGSGARRAGVALAALLCLSLALAPADAAKKGKKKGSPNKVRVFSSGPLSSTIPDDPGVNAVGALQSQIFVGKAMKGRRIDDVNVSVRLSHPVIQHLTADLTAPNGATTEIVPFSSGTAWGSGATDCTGTPLTLDDETPIEISQSGNPGFNQLAAPYAGTAQPGDLFVPLAVMDGGPISGAWTLTLRDQVPVGVGTLHCWQVQVKPRPLKRGKK